MNHIYTIENGRVAGRPGPMRIPWNLAQLRANGFRVVISLECERVDAAEILAEGLEHKLLCIPDLTAPTVFQILEFNQFVDRKLRDGHNVLVHGFEGRGRPGTMLASRLIRQGMTVTDAIAHIRREIDSNLGSAGVAIDPGQEAALHGFAEWGGQHACRPPLTARPANR